MKETIHTVNCYNDWGCDIPIGFFTDFDAACRAIRQMAKKECLRLKEVEPGKFKDLKSTNGEDYHYCVEEVKLNKKLS